jgi:hypothetical protein
MVKDLFAIAGQGRERQPRLVRPCQGRARHSARDSMAARRRRLLHRHHHLRRVLL